MRKRYEVRGMMEWHPVFKVGRTQVQVSFTGGCLCGGANTPATFETSDPVVQKVIESSVAFRSKKITVGMVMEDRLPSRSDGATEYGATASQPSGQSECNDASGRVGSRPTIFEYSDDEDIYDFLHYKKGVPLESMNEKGACYREAERLGIELVKKSQAGS